MAGTDHNLRVRRQALGLSQRALGERAGVPRGSALVAVSKLESGGTVCYGQSILDTLRAIERERGVTPPRDYRLRARRERLGLSPAQLGELAGLPVGPEGAQLVMWAERGRATAILVTTIRQTLVWEESRPRRRREEQRLNDQRIARQEAAWAALPDSPEKAALLAAMLERCLDLMHNGSGEECDAIAEWLPPADVERMFERWWVEQGADRRCACCVPEGLVLA